MLSLLYLDISDSAAAALEPLHKPYVVSLSGLTLADNVEMLTKTAEAKFVSAIEINLACPNIAGID